MSLPYSVDTEDIRFVLFDQLDIDGEMSRLARYADFDRDLYDAMLDDLRIHLGGSRTDLFVPDQWKEVVAAWTATPAGIQAQTWVEFQGVPHFFNPIAAEGDVPVPRTLIWEGSVEPAVKASVATIASSGTAELDLPGCAKLKTKAPSPVFSMHCV